MANQYDLYNEEKGKYFKRLKKKQGQKILSKEADG